MGKQSSSVCEAPTGAPSDWLTALTGACVPDPVYHGIDWYVCCDDTKVGCCASGTVVGTLYSEVVWPGG